MECNTPLANNACSAELGFFSMHVIHSALDIVAKFFPGLIILTQRQTLLNTCMEVGCEAMAMPRSCASLAAAATPL